MGKSSYHTVIKNTLYMFGGDSTEYCNSAHRPQPSMCGGDMVEH